MKSKFKIIDFDLALCRSAIFEALSLAFRPPNQETMHRLLNKNQNRALAEVAVMLDKNFSEKKGDRLTSLVSKLPKCRDAQNLKVLENSYRCYFGHTAQSKVPPYETEYGQETLFQQPQQLGDIAGFYHAFGLNLNLNAHERVDHISCELEFLAFLTRKEAYALEHDDPIMLQETRKAQKLFLKDHLARFSPSFAKLLMREDLDGFYGVLGKLCLDFILLECAHYGVTAGPEHLRLRPTVLSEECYSCGSGEEIIQNIGDK
ncbi:MAG: molecular chaperone [bacterium]